MNIPSNNKLRKATKAELIDLIKQLYSTLESADSLSDAQSATIVMLESNISILETEIKELKKPWYKKIF